jgi:hypothetical protein
MRRDRNDRLIRTHVIDDADEPVVENGKGLPENFLQLRNAGPSKLLE